MLTDQFYTALGAAFRRRPLVERRWFIAVGTGRARWDRRPPRVRRNVTELVHEIARKEVAPEDVTFLDEAGDPVSKPTPRVLLRVKFEGDEAVGPLRECGLFGGEASKHRGSGALTSYFTHPRLEKSEGMSLTRTVRVDFTPPPEDRPPSVRRMPGGVVVPETDATRPVFPSPPR